MPEAGAARDADGAGVGHTPCGCRLGLIIPVCAHGHRLDEIQQQHGQQPCFCFPARAVAKPLQQPTWYRPPQELCEWLFGCWGDASSKGGSKDVSYESCKCRPASLYVFVSKCQPPANSIISSATVPLDASYRQRPAVPHSRQDEP